MTQEKLQEQVMLVQLQLQEVMDKLADLQRQVDGLTIALYKLHTKPKEQ